MQNHKCAFANYCSNYDNNRCQGCAKAGDDDGKKSKNPDVEKLKYKLITDALYGTMRKNNKCVTTKDTIQAVIFNAPATVVIWTDGTKTVVKCQDGDTYSKETGLAMAIAKKFLGNRGNFNEVFKKWIPEYVETKDEK